MTTMQGTTTRMTTARRTSPRLLATAAAVILAALLLLPAGAAAKKNSSPPIKHVFVVVLENENAAETFSPTSQIPYLAQTLVKKGAFIPNYYGIGHSSLPNYLALISGQAPNQQTQDDCGTYTEFAPATPAPNGQFLGDGCLFPASVPTLAGQLTAKKKTWRGYMEDMVTSCRHPVPGTPDTTQAARVGDQYAARHNPFVYFRSITDTPACAANDVDLSRLQTDLKRQSTTATYSMIVPNLCNDAHDGPCVDGAAGGLVQANGWLQRNIPPILKSPGYKHGGLLIVTFDEAEGGGPTGDGSACCGEIPGPNLALPGRIGPGGGRIGAVALSPCIKRHTTVRTAYNHYSLLHTVEKLFKLPPLGFAAGPGAAPFGKSLFNATKSKKCR
jgi:hypothetical protein